MGIITFKANMDLIDVVSRNHFLKELYPKGLFEDMLIGHLSFNCDNRFGLNLHTKQRPAKEVKKWGIWGKHYDVIVICLLGQLVKDIKIDNWELVDFAPVIWTKNGENITMHSHKESWEVSLTFSSLVLQECRTYTW